MCGAVAVAFVVTFVLVGAAVLLRTGDSRPDADTRTDAKPHIDTFVFQQGAAKALLRGHNPYAISNYPDIYESGSIDRATGEPRQAVYGPGLSDGRTLRFGFPYLPASLYFATPGYAIVGDHRFAQLAAVALAGVLIWRSRPAAASHSSRPRCC